MFYKKPGFPEDGELLICTVKKVLPHSVFVELDEYGKEGMIHISEVSPGRIRNIRDYVQEGKKVICKVLRTDKEKRHIDLSLRRVNQAQKINKNDEYKQEQKAEKILESIANSLKKDIAYMYKEAGTKILEKYPTLNACFQDIVNKDINLKELGINEKLADEISKVVKDKISPKKVAISGVLELKSEKGNGIEIIKQVLNRIKNKDIDILYLGAPRYKMVVNASDYKKAELLLKKSLDEATSMMKNQGLIKFNRDD